MKTYNQTETGSFEMADTTQHKPEWVRSPEVERLYGIKKSTLLNLVKAQKIRSVLLHATGSRGIRIFDISSVRRFVEQCAEGGNDAKS